MFVLNNHGCTQEEIMAGTKGNAAKKYAVFACLKQECLQQTKGGKRGDPYRYSMEVPVEGDATPDMPVVSPSDEVVQ